MKKVFLSLAVLASVAMVSCGKKAASEGEAAATDSVAATEVVEEVAAPVDTVNGNDSVAVANDSVKA
ncbi:MAG: hypothetical protein PUD39_02875 [Bacteroidales bacterium]|nr:hypothetical protein [Bacteroidales bacterium]